MKNLIAIGENLCLCSNLLENIIPGGGAYESWMAAKLSRYAQTLPESSRVLVDQCSRSLLEIPFHICENATIDSSQVYALQDHYGKNPKCDLGIDICTRTVGSMINKRIFEYLPCKQAAMLKSFEHVSCCIITS
jgi:chaperonin GroEL (HSP60 family)